MSAVIFNSDRVQALEAGIKLLNSASILSGTVDPTSVATTGQIGSLYLNTSNGNVYRKTDNGSSTNWSAMPITSGGGTFDPTTTFGLFEDFATGGYLGSGQIQGDHIWCSTQSGSPTLTGQGSIIPSDNAHPGVIELGTAGNSTYGAGITTGVFGGTVTSAFLNGNGQITFEALINIPTISDGTDNFQLFIGFRDSGPWNAAGKGWGIQYDLGASVNWQLVTVSASTTTSLISSVAVTTGWHHLKMICNAGGTSVQGLVDGVSLGSNSTNIPSANVPPMLAIRKVLGTNARYLGIDYIKIDITFTTPR